MITKTYTKFVSRMFKENLVRLLLIGALTGISTALVAGLGTVAPRLRRTTEYLRNLGFEELHQHDFLADGIERISFVFPMFFILVTALVVFMTITRLIETDRSQIGCLKTLGFSKSHIMFKYLLFTAVASFGGNLGGLLFGYYVFYPIIFASITELLYLPTVGSVFPTFGLVAAIITFVFSLLVTFITVLITVRGKPAKLLRGRPPSHGGKILFERMPLFWNRLPFRYKSSLRNIFRYRVRFFMTVFTMLFSTALVFSGISLSFALEYTNPYLMDTVRPISTIIVIAAVLLNAMVIYNITNINIEERKREMATLMVLGYRNIEVSGYIFREIFILTIFGVAAGLPMGYLMIDLIFEYLMFGGIEFVDWYVWIITTVLAFSSLALANLLLFRKIHNTDMNSSLKTIE